ncbi:MAG: autotransporter-associated beta strand repeat-containing protein [Phycisphaeraceae bacterium]
MSKHRKFRGLFTLAAVAGALGCLAQAAQANVSVVFYWPTNTSLDWSNIQDSSVGDTTGWSDVVGSDGIGDIADNANAGSGNFATARFTNMTGRVITLDASHTVGNLWYNWNGTGGSTASGSMTISPSGGSVLTLDRGDNAAPEIHVGYRFAQNDHTLGLFISATLAGNDGFSLKGPTTDSYSGRGLILSGVNTISGTASVGSSVRLELRNVQSAEFLTLQMAGGSMLGLRHDVDGATFVTGTNPNTLVVGVGLRQVTNNATTTINVDRASAGGGTGHLLKLAGDYAVTGGNGTKTLNITGGNGYSLEMTGNFNNTTATAVNINADSANFKLSGSTAAIGSVGLQLGGLAASGINEIAADISGTGAVTKLNDTSTWTLSGTNAYSGVTNINGGTLLVNGTHSGGAVYTVNTGGKLGGTGSIASAITVNTGGTLAPGASIESLASGSNTWNGGGNLEFEFSTDGSGAPGTEGDQLAITGGLDLTGASSGNPFTIKLFTMADANTPGALATWNANLGHTWASFVTTTTGFTLFDSSKFVFDTAGFLNGTPTGTFSVVQNGQNANNLDLVYIVPEPASLALLGLGGLLMIHRRRREQGLGK